MFKLLNWTFNFWPRNLCVGRTGLDSRRIFRLLKLGYRVYSIKLSVQLIGTLTNAHATAVFWCLCRAQLGIICTVSNLTTLNMCQDVCYFKKIGHGLDESLRPTGSVLWGILTLTAKAYSLSTHKNILHVGSILKNVVFDSVVNNRNVQSASWAHLVKQYLFVTIGSVLTLFI